MLLKKAVLLIFILFSLQVNSQKLEWKEIDSGTEASFRSLSIVNNSVAWVGGSKGVIGKTTNGGKTWDFQQVPGYEEADFRTLYAFDDQEAVIATTTKPALVLKTKDGGKTWKTAHALHGEHFFIDGIDFWDDKNGVIYGDPFNGRMLLLKTTSRGDAWVIFPEEQRPKMDEGEASFAASGTNIRCVNDSDLLIASGGMKSRIYYSPDRAKTWKILKSPIIQGEPSRGIFSMAVRDDLRIMTVGGDYLQQDFSIDHTYLLMSINGKWHFPKPATRGYRECVEWIDDNTLITVGPGGMEISHNTGLSWQVFGMLEGMHVVRRARKGDLIIAAGANGKIAVLEK